MAPPSRAWMGLIPTEATPVPTPEASASPSPPPPASSSLGSKLAPRSAATAIVRAVPVSNGFVALPVQQQGGIDGLPNGLHHIYLRRRESEHGLEDDGRTVFAVNLPYASTEETVKQGIEELLKARSSAAKGKGKAKETASDLTVESVDFVASTIAKRSITLLEKEGISRPEDLLARAESSGKPEKQSIHPLFISSNIDVKSALAHLHPSPYTLKAHITLLSKNAVQILLAEKGSWQSTSWPSANPAAPLNGISTPLVFSQKEKKKRKSTTDEVLYDLSRPSSGNIKMHVDSWMSLFESTHPSKSSSSSSSSASKLPVVAPVKKSKRALAREAAIRAKKLADLERQKAIKKRRLYDDDFLDPNADEEGWITVTADGGVKGRSNLPGAEGNDEDGEMVIEDEEEIRKAELEGFASGKRSVGIARRQFVKAQESELKAERDREKRALNAKLGIESVIVPGEKVEDNTDQMVKGDAGEVTQLLQRDMDDSRGGGRGKKKKRSRGIEVNMYGFHRREEKKKGLNDLKKRFKEDKQRIEEMKRQKRFKPY